MKNRLYKDNSNRKLGGVCSGLAEYLGVDVTIVRIAVAFLCLYSNVCIPIYFLMMIILPDKSEVEREGGDPEASGDPRHRRRLLALLLCSLLIMAGSRLVGRSSSWFSIALPLLGLYLLVSGISSAKSFGTPAPYVPRIVIGSLLLGIGLLILFGSGSLSFVTPFAALVSSARYLWPLLCLAMGLTLIFPARRSVLTIWIITALIIIFAAVGSAML